MVPLGDGLLASVDDVGDDAVPLDDAQEFDTAVSSIGTQVLAAMPGGHRVLDCNVPETGSNRLLSFTLSAVTTIDSGTPRPSTSR
jgi:hypothetical protein